MSSTASDMESLKSRLKATWIAGDFSQIAKSYESGAAGFIHRLNIAPGTRVLDVACGTGNLAIPAARAGAVVTGADIATNLLEQGRARAKAEGLTIRFEEGDAGLRAISALLVREDVQRILDKSAQSFAFLFRSNVRGVRPKRQLSMDVLLMYCVVYETHQCKFERRTGRTG